MSKKFTTNPKQYVKCTTTKEMKDAAKLLQYILTEKKDVFTKYQADRLDEAIGILKNASKYDKDEGLIKSSCGGKKSVKGSKVCASGELSQMRVEDIEQGLIDKCGWSGYGVDEAFYYYDGDDLLDAEKVLDIIMRAYREGGSESAEEDLADAKECLRKIGFSI